MQTGGLRVVWKTVYKEQALYTQVKKQLETFNTKTDGTPLREHYHVWIGAVEYFEVHENVP